MSERCDAVVGGRPGALARCYRLAHDGGACLWCNAVVFWCRLEGHEESALRNLDGHALLVHPEKVPEAVELLLREPERLELARRLAAQAPGQYARLREFLTEKGVTL